MTGELLRVMVCPPGNAGWNLQGKAAAWQELGGPAQPHCRGLAERPRLTLIRDSHMVPERKESAILVR